MVNPSEERSFVLIIRRLESGLKVRTGNPKVVAAVKYAAVGLRYSKSLIFAIGKGEKLSKAGRREMIVVATAEPHLLYSEVFCNTLLILASQAL